MSTSLPSIAVRNVARNGRRSFITLAAVLLGVTAVIVLRGISDGFVRLMEDEVVQGRTGALQIHRKGFVDSVEALPLEPNMPYDDEMRERIRSVPGVTGVTGHIQFSGLVSNGVSQTMFVGRALDMKTEKQAVPRSGFDVRVGGEELTETDYTHGIFGAELIKSFGAVTQAAKKKALAENAPGAQALVEQVTLSSTSPKGRSNSFDVSIKGLSDSNLPFENKRVATVPLALAQDLLGMQGRVTEYAVAVDNLENLERIAAELRTKLGPEYEVHTWQELQPFVRDVIVRLKVVLGFVSAVLGIIIVTGIINVMLMSVFERVREIGTMLAVGVRRRQVLTLFLTEAAFLGLLGSVGGAAIGSALVALLASKGIPMKSLGSGVESLLRPELHAPFMLGTLVFATLGAILAASYPAWKASRMQPVDALRSV